MSGSSSEDFRKRLVNLLEKCTGQVLLELEEEILERLRIEGKEILDEFFQEAQNGLAIRQSEVFAKKNEAVSLSKAQEFSDEGTLENAKASESSSTKIWYGYCIIPEGKCDVSSINGLDDSECLLVNQEGLSMVISALPRFEYDEEALHNHMQDLEWVEVHAKRHEEVLLAIMAETTLIPLPFCTLFLEEESINKQLVSRKQLLLNELARVANCYEVMIKLLVRLDILHEQLKVTIPQPEGGGSNYFRRLQQEKQREQEWNMVIESYGENLLGALREFSEESTLLERESVDVPEGLILVFAAQFLISEEKRTLWEEQLLIFDQMADPWGFLIQVLGPLPPYHFTQLKED